MSSLSYVFVSTTASSVFNTQGEVQMKYKYFRYLNALLLKLI